MAISLTCPDCNATISVADEYAGQTGPCPECGRQISVPAVPQDQLPTRPQVALARRLRISAYRKWALWAGGLILLGWFLIRVLPTIQAVKDVSNASACSKNLRRIGRAVLAYEADHGAFPPASSADENGRPMHSWRVLILPYLGRQDLYEMYDFDEAWNGPANSLLADQIGDLYRCPSEENMGDHWLDEETGVLDTSYMMVVGPNTISDGPSAKSLSDVTDAPYDTFLVVETGQSGIHWMDPRDLAESQISLDSYDPSVPIIWADHFFGANAVMCDGSVRVISDSIDPDQLEAMSTISGGESVWK